MVPEQILLAAAVSLAAVSASEVELRRSLMRSRARPHAVRHHHAKHFGQQQAGGEQQMVGVVTTYSGDLSRPRPRLQGEAGQEEAGRQLLPPAPRRQAQAGEQALHGAAPGGAETGRGQAM